MPCARLWRKGKLESFSTKKHLMIMFPSIRCHASPQRATCNGKGQICHIANNVHNTKKWAVWHGERREFYEHFPLSVFKNKIRQEIKTAKYLHTLEVRGKDTRKTKDMTNEPLDGQDAAIPSWL